MLSPILPIGVLLTFAMISASPSYWFHPKHLLIVRQNRAVALSAYLCGPLLWIALLMSIAGGVMAVLWFEDIDQPSLIWSLRLVLTLLGLATFVMMLLLAWNT